MAWLAFVMDYLSLASPKLRRRYEDATADAARMWSWMPRHNESTVWDAIRLMWTGGDVTAWRSQVSLENSSQNVSLFMGEGLPAREAHTITQFLRRMLELDGMNHSRLFWATQG